MVEVNGTTITMVRGDTLSLQLTIKNADGTTYTPASTDAIRFALKKNYSDANPILNKTIPYNTLTLTLVPNDTKTLGMGDIDGRYHYDIEITKADGTVDTIIPRSDFIILEEVH